MRETLAAHSSESAAATALRVLTRCMIAAAICDRAAKAAQTAAVASQVVAVLRLELALVFLEEERVMHHSSVSISLSF